MLLFGALSSTSIPSYELLIVSAVVHTANEYNMVVRSTPNYQEAAEHAALIFVGMSLWSIRCERSGGGSRPSVFQMVYQTQIKEWALTCGMVIGQESGYV